MLTCRNYKAGMDLRPATEMLHLSTASCWQLQVECNCSAYLFIKFLKVIAMSNSPQTVHMLGYL